MKTLFLTTPSEKRLTAFKAQMVRMQEALFHELEPHLSADAVKQLREKPKEWEFVLPNSREKQIQLLKREIEQALNETKKDSQTQLAPQSAFERAIELVHFAHLKHRQSRIGALCASFATDIPGDFVSENRIQVSPLTVQLKDHKAAFYHELMHLALKALSGPDADEQTRQWVAKTQECLRENHAEGADEQMINEDFADLVAFSTEAATTTSYICPVTDLQVLTRARTNPFDPFIGSSQSWIYKRSPGDQGYSSSLFRKLHSHVVRGKAIPEACRQVADNEGYEIKLKNCLAR